MTSGSMLQHRIEIPRQYHYPYWSPRWNPRERRHFQVSKYGTQSVYQDTLAVAKGFHAMWISRGHTMLLLGGGWHSLADGMMNCGLYSHLQRTYIIWYIYNYIIHILYIYICIIYIYIYIYMYNIHIIHIYTSSMMVDERILEFLILIKQI